MTTCKSILLACAFGLSMGGLSMVTGCASQRPAVMTSPTEADLRQAMAIAEQAQGEFERKNYNRAIELYNQALALRPDLGTVFNELGLALEARGKELDYMNAIEAFKRSADLMPVDHRPYQNLGALYYDRGFADEAHRYFNLALERDPNNLDCLRGSVGAAKLMLRSEEAGLQRVNRALLIDNDPAWRKIEEFERVRIQHDLAEAAMNATGTSSGTRAIYK